jgi:hypothetical protein
MLKPNSIIVCLLASLSLCAGTLRGERDALPGSTPKEGIPVPMTAFKVPIVRAKPDEDAALGLLDIKPVDHGEVAVRFKTLTTNGDQAAGIVLRYQDPSNYYVIVASAKEESCTLYRMRDGKPKTIDSQDAIVTPMTWHELRVTFAQDKFTAILDEELVLGTKDSGLKAPGLVGLWTRAGSKITFSNFRVSRP